MYFLVRIGEIWLKSPKTRKAMINRLVEDITARLEMAGINAKIKIHGPRILLESDQEITGIIKKVPGVTSISPGQLVKTDLKSIEEAVFNELRGHSGTFSIRVNRAWKGFEMKSPELAAHLARIPELRGVSLKVDLENPEKAVFVDLRREFTFVYSKVIPGPGGLPYGSQGKALALFSGGLDSPVASWMMIKRGLALDFLFLNPYGDVLEALVYSVFKKVKEWAPKSKLYAIRIPDIYSQIREKIPEGYRQGVYKRIMYKIGIEFAKKINAKALVTGESLGQVSTQTLNNLVSIQSDLDFLFLRPLIGMNKEETVRIAREIGTYDLSSKIPEFCKLENHSRANIPERMLKYFETRIDYDISKLVEDAREVREVKIPDLKPRSMGGLEVVKLWEGEPVYEKGKKYLIICKSGLSAQEMAYNLRKRGIEAYALSESEWKKMRN